MTSVKLALVAVVTFVTLACGEKPLPSSPTSPTGVGQVELDVPVGMPRTGTIVTTSAVTAGSRTANCGGVARLAGNYFPCCQYNGKADGGNCTYLAANLAIQHWGKAVPMTGNASTWASVASSNGYTVSKVPVARSIGVNTKAVGGLGHVAWVRTVLADGRVEVEEQLCGSAWETRVRLYDAGYFDAGYILPPGANSEYRAEFNRDGNFEGWSIVNAYAEIRGGALQLDPGHGDFYTTSPAIAVSADTARRIVVRMASNAVDGRASIYFQTQSEPYFDESKRIDFSVRNCSLCGSAPYEDRWVNAAAHPKWRGVVVRVRLDPANAGSGGTNRDAVGVDYVRVIP